MKYFVFFIIMIFGLHFFSKSDTIVTNRKNLANITITREHFDKIGYYFNQDSSRTPQFIDRKREKIVKIERLEYPTEYKIAESHFESQIYNRAIQAYERAERVQDWTAQHCLYQIGLCYQKMKNYPKAIFAYKKLLDSFPETYYKADVHFNSGMCYLEGRRPSNALPFFQRAASLYEEISDPEKAMESMYYFGQAAEKNKEYTKAIQVYESLLKKISDESLKNSVQLSLGHCYFQAKNISKSKEAFLQILKNISPENRENMASLYFGLGNCYFQEQNTKDALLCYLRLIMLYESQDETTRQAYDRAAYCFDLLKSQNPEYADRARQIKQMKEQKFK